MEKLAEGTLQKLEALPGQPLQYHLPVGEQRIPLNPLIGKALCLHWTGEIYCIYCQRKTGKSFNQGYCYPCFKRLARCDTCIVSPEKCHFDKGTCREPEWAQQHCMVDHIVYLSNTSGVKIGITRHTQVPTRWIDQGASAAIPLLKVKTRQQSGLIEDALKPFVADKTNWRQLLKGEPDKVDFSEVRAVLEDKLSEAISDLPAAASSEVEWLDEKEQEFVYPVAEYPAKISSLNLDKDPEATGNLLGVKGQYLILDTGVINIRKYTAYNVIFSAASV